MNPSGSGSSVDFLQVVSSNTVIPHSNDFIKWLRDISQLTEIKEENITVRIVDEPESQVLNKQYRGKDKPTNVLSFPSQLPVEIQAEYLGDIVICAPVVEQEACDQNKPVKAHWVHMLVHGILHLKGYDHIDDEEALEMETLEKAILAEMGFPDPYAE